jgi:hypothetical protein
MLSGHGAVVPLFVTLEVDCDTQVSRLFGKHAVTIELRVRSFAIVNFE